MPGLRAKLNALKRETEAPAPRAARGLAVYAATADLPEALMSPSSEALRRIGWNGKKFDIESCLFLDTETTGLSGGAGTVAFLVGLGWAENGRMRIEQLFMRDYSDEPELLEALSKRLGERECVVTFNGRSFDMPLLNARFILNRMRGREDMFNLDLLHPSRRAWKLRIESCRLSNIEEKLLGITRENDLPGADVPARYFEFLKTGDMALVDDIIAHNRQDVATMALLLARLLETYGNPEAQSAREDIYSLGKALEKQGEGAKARELYRMSAIPPKAGSLSAMRAESISAQANWRLYKLSLRAGDVSAAREAIEQLIARGQLGCMPCVEMAKICEHRLGDPRAALEYTYRALELCAPQDEEAIMLRAARLKRKLAKKSEE